MKFIIVKFKEFFKKIFGLRLYKTKSLINYYIVNISKYKHFENEQERRKNIEIFDYSNISVPLPLISKKHYLHNSFYGMEDNFKKYTNFNKGIKAIIEHGIYFGDFVEPLSKNPAFKTIITYSLYRKKIIEKYTDKKVITVGPYIHYVNYLLPESELIKIKNSLGKTLLVFPMHSTIQLNLQYSHANFLNFLDTIKNDFDSILVCFYWKDIHNKNHIPFIEKGFKVVCAGHLMDSHFLHRIKSFIYLSDYVVTNSIGTHIGYCIYLKKPVFYFEQDYKIDESKDGDLKKEMDFRGNNYIKSYNDVTKDLKSKFSRYGEYVISKEQYDLVNNIWGLDQVRSNIDLKKLISLK